MSVNTLAEMLECPWGGLGVLETKKEDQVHQWGE